MNQLHNSKHPSIVSIGDNVVDIYAEQEITFPGGNTVNVAVFAARAGARSAYIGRVGPDAAAAAIESALVEESVDTRFLRRVPGETAHCVIAHVDGDRLFRSSDLGVSRFTPQEEEFAFIDGADAVHVGASSGLDEHIERFARHSRLSYDFATPRDSEHLRQVCPHTFLATVSGGSIDEVAVEHLAREAVDAGATWVLVTLGARGAVLASGSRRWSIDAVPTEVVDTLGAGDSFIARLLVGLLSRESPQDALAAAAALASRTCGAYGAFGYGSRSIRQEPSFSDRNNERKHP